MNCSPPGFSVHGFLQARIREWFAISFSMASSRPRGWTGVSCISGRVFTVWATRKAQGSPKPPSNFRTFSEPLKQTFGPSAPSPISALHPRCHCQATTHLCFCFCKFWTLRINGIMRYVAFCDGLLSLTTMPSRSIHCSASQHLLPFCCRIVFHCVTDHTRLPAPQLMDSWVVPPFWLLWII